MSKSKAQVHELMCLNLAAECEELAADVVEPDIKANLLRMARHWADLVGKPSVLH